MQGVRSVRHGVDGTEVVGQLYGGQDQRPGAILRAGQQDKFLEEGDGDLDRPFSPARSTESAPPRSNRARITPLRQSPKG
jgi:hypothetical protein